MNQIVERDASEIRPWHEFQDNTKYRTLVASMQDNGWTGAPIVVIDGERPQAITGSHRIPAAEFVGIKVPTVDIDDLLRDAGTALAELDEEYGNNEGDHYEAICRLAYHLPDNVIEHYGLDAA